MTKWAAILTIAVLIGGLACGVAFAAVEDSPPVTLDLKDVEVRSAIDALFRGRPGMNFSVSQDVSGIVPSLSISNVPFDSALKSLLKTSGLVYRIENGVYMISKKPDSSPDASVAAVAVAAAVPGSDVAIDETTTVESTIDRIPLSNMGASQMIQIMTGSSQQYGGITMASGYSGGMMMGSYGGGSFGGMGGGYGSRGSYGGYGGGYGGVYGGGMTHGSYGSGMMVGSRSYNGGGAPVSSGVPVGGGVPAMGGVAVIGGR